MRKELILNSLRKAKGNHESKDGLIHHSDRGSEYVSNAYQQTLRSNGTITSMSRKVNRYDNAVAENFFAILKTEYCFEHGVFENREAFRVYRDLLKF